jgi:hypothetical protein
VIRQRVFHPLLFAAYPVLALLAYNIDWLRPQQGLRALLLSIGVALLLLVVLARLLHSWHRAGLLVSLFLILFFSYGHLYDSLKLGLGAEIGRHRYLAPVFLAAGAGLAWWILRRVRHPEAATRVLNLVGAVAVAFPLFTLARWGYLALTTTQTPPATTAALHLPEGQRPPDIYYIIVDAYGRQDTLQKVFDMDNSPFLSFLEDHGFYVARSSRSNYAQTGLSLASSLNMDYVDKLIPNLTSESQGRGALWKLIQHSEVRRQLESLGYTTVAFSTGLTGTEWTDADYYYTAGSADKDLSLRGATPFESLIMETSLVRLVSDGVVALPRLLPGLRYPYEIHRSRIRFIFQELKNLPPTKEPKFVFAHIISPHPPFVFAADGTPVTPNVPFSLRFTFFGGDPGSQAYIDGYSEQVKFVNSQLEEVVQAILKNSEVPPVIIIQGDHGPDSNSGRLSYVQERMTNFNAYHLPGGNAGLYPGITPVNSFRLIFDDIFGGKYPLLKDQVYFSQYDTPYNLVDETASIQQP